MDRRFLTWLLLTSALFFLYLSFRPAPQQPQPLADKPAAPESDDPLLNEPPAASNSDDTSDPTSDDGEQTTDEGKEDAIADSARSSGESGPEAGSPTYPRKLITLGSMDPAENFNLLVTLSSQGAGVVRVELIEQPSPGNFRFRALEHDGGYLGFLGWLEQSDGLLIQTIPDGSPAAAATCGESEQPLQIGDLVTAINGTPTTSLLELEELLLDAQPGTTAEITIRRPSSAGEDSQLTYTTTFTEAPLDVLRTDPSSNEQVAGNSNRPSLRTTLASLGSTNIPSGMDALPALRDTLAGNWEVKPFQVQGGAGVEFRLPLSSYLAGSGRPEALDLVKRYRLYPEDAAHDGYLLDLETVLENHNDVPIQVGLRQEGLSGLTLEGWWYSVKISPYMFSGAGQRDVLHYTDFAGHQVTTTRQILQHAKENPSAPDKLILSPNESREARDLAYIGLDSQYFNASILPHREAPASLSDLYKAGTSTVATPEMIPKSKAQATNVSFWLETQEQSIAPGEKISQRYDIFIGPKDTELLATHGLERTIEYGWFGWIAKPLSAILHFFYGIVRNYALAIVLLTVMVRAAMFPLGRKAAMNAQKMQELQPELQKINEKYKDNMEKRAKAMQEIYAKHNFKPLAGCLPMFIQLPIFIGLYRCLSVDISLRQASLIPGMNWCSNLAGPDMLLNWSSWMPEFIAGRGSGWLGPYFNLLPMVTVALFLAQQKMLMPKATDEQTRMTQKMMQFMTIFMGVLFFKVPSGLCIYFITSSIWSLVERKLVKSTIPKKSEASTTTSNGSNESATPKTEDGGSAKNRKRRTQLSTNPNKSGKFEELKKMLEKPAVRSTTQRGSKKQRKRRKP